MTTTTPVETLPASWDDVAAAVSAARGTDITAPATVDAPARHDVVPIRVRRTR